MKEDCVIIGGGVAGLCAAIRLTELGIHPLIVEAGTYPSQKVCGEFFSPEIIPQLKKWNINPLEIKSSHFHVEGETIKFSFSSPAGSLSHHTFDPLLLQRALSNGAKLQAETKVMRIEHNSNSHYLFLSDGSKVEAAKMVIATGRGPQMDSSPQKIKYVGIKAHFEAIPLKDKLEMFFFKGAYIGISPIEEGKCNVACLVKIKDAKRFGTSDMFIKHLMSKNKLLHFYLSQGKLLFSKWMTAHVPEFGIKITPEWEETYFIGDAAGTIPPVSGDGLSIAIKSGILAAEFAVHGDALAFKKVWKEHNKKAIYCSQLLNKICLSPLLGNKIFQMGKLFPSVIKKIFQMTRIK
jgi:menaquinone-9 beta-reductase